MQCERSALLKAGEPCNDPSGATLCGGATTCLKGTCIQPATDGTPCDPAQGIRCLDPAGCFDGFCRFRPTSCSSAE